MLPSKFLLLFFIFIYFITIFKIKGSSPSKYLVQPNKGVIGPGEKLRIEFTALAHVKQKIKKIEKKLRQILFPGENTDKFLISVKECFHINQAYFMGLFNIVYLFQLSENDFWKSDTQDQKFHVVYHQEETASQNTVNFDHTLDMIEKAKKAKVDLYSTIINRPLEKPVRMISIFDIEIIKKEENVPQEENKNHGDKNDEVLFEEQQKKIGEFKDIIEIKNQRISSLEEELNIWKEKLKSEQDNLQKEIEKDKKDNEFIKKDNEEKNEIIFSLKNNNEDKPLKYEMSSSESDILKEFSEKLNKMTIDFEKELKEKNIEISYLNERNQNLNECLKKGEEELQKNDL